MSSKTPPQEACDPNVSPLEDLERSMTHLAHENELLKAELVKTKSKFREFECKQHEYLRKKQKETHSYKKQLTDALCAQNDTQVLLLDACEEKRKLVQIIEGLQAESSKVRVDMETNENLLYEQITDLTKENSLLKYEISEIREAAGLEQSRRQTWASELADAREEIARLNQLLCTTATALQLQRQDDEHNRAEQSRVNGSVHMLASWVSSEAFSISAVLNQLIEDLRHEAEETHKHQRTMLRENKHVNLELRQREQALTQAHSMVEEFKKKKVEYDQQVRNLHSRFMQAKTDSSGFLPSQSPDDLMRSSALLLRQLGKSRGNDTGALSVDTNESMPIIASDAESPQELVPSTPTNEIRQLSTSELVRSIHERMEQMDEKQVATIDLHNHKPVCLVGATYLATIRHELEARCLGLHQQLSECHSLIADLKLCEQENIQASLEVQMKATGERNQLLTNIHKLEKECEDRRKEHAVEADRLKAINIDLEEQARGLETRMHRLQSQTDEVVSGLADELQRSKVEERQLRESCATKELRLEQLIEQLDMVQQQRDMLIERAQEKEHLSDREDECTEEMWTVDEGSREEERACERAELERAVAEAEASRREAEEGRRAAEAAVEGVEGKMKAGQDERELLEVHVAAVMAEAEGSVRELEGKMAQLEEGCREAEEQLRSASESAAAAQAEVWRLQQAAEDQEARAREADREAAARVAGVEEASRRAQSEAEKARKACAAKEGECMELFEALRAVERERDALERDLEAAEAGARGGVGAEEELRHQVEEMARERNALKKEVEVAHRVIGDGAASLRRAESRVSALEAERAALDRKRSTQREAEAAEAHRMAEELRLAQENLEAREPAEARGRERVAELEREVRGQTTALQEAKELQERERQQLEALKAELEAMENAKTEVEEKLERRVAEEASRSAETAETMAKRVAEVKAEADRAVAAMAGEVALAREAAEASKAEALSRVEQVRGLETQLGTAAEAGRKLQREIEAVREETEKGLASSRDLGDGEGITEWELEAEEEMWTVDEGSREEERACERAELERAVAEAEASRREAEEGRRAAEAAAGAAEKKVEEWRAEERMRSRARELEVRSEMAQLEAEVRRLEQALEERDERDASRGADGDGGRARAGSAEAMAVAESLVRQLLSEVDSAVATAAAAEEDVGAIGNLKPGPCQGCSAECKVHLGSKILRLQWELKRSSEEKEGWLAEMERLRSELKAATDAADLHLHHHHRDPIMMAGSLTRKPQHSADPSASASQRAPTPTKSGLPAKRGPSGTPNTSSPLRLLSRPSQGRKSGSDPAGDQPPAYGLRPRLTAGTFASEQKRRGLSEGAGDREGVSSPVQRSAPTASGRRSQAGKENMGQPHRVHGGPPASTQAKAAGATEARVAFKELCDAVLALEPPPDNAASILSVKDGKEVDRARKSSAAEAAQRDPEKQANVMARCKAVLEDLAGQLRAKERRLAESEVREKTLQREWELLRRRESVRLSPPPED